MSINNITNFGSNQVQLLNGVGRGEILPAIKLPVDLTSEKANKIIGEKKLLISSGNENSAPFEEREDPIFSATILNSQESIFSNYEIPDDSNLEEDKNQIQSDSDSLDNEISSTDDEDAFFEFDELSFEISDPKQLNLLSTLQEELNDLKQMTENEEEEGANLLIEGELSINKNFENTLAQEMKISENSEKEIEQNVFDIVKLKKNEAKTEENLSKLLVKEGSTEETKVNRDIKVKSTKIQKVVIILNQDVIKASKIYKEKGDVVNNMRGLMMINKSTGKTELAPILDPIAMAKLLKAGLIIDPDHANDTYYVSKKSGIPHNEKQMVGDKEITFKHRSEEQEQELLEKYESFVELHLASIKKEEKKEEEIKEGMNNHRVDIPQSRSVATDQNLDQNTTLRDIIRSETLRKLSSISINDKRAEEKEILKEEENKDMLKSFIKTKELNKEFINSEIFGRPLTCTSRIIKAPKLGKPN